MLAAAFYTGAGITWSGLSGAGVGTGLIFATVSCTGLHSWYTFSLYSFYTH